MREIELLRHQIYRIKGFSPPTGPSPASSNPPIPLVIVGTKSDLVTEREVSRDLMNKYSTLWGVPFYETSAKMDWNVTEVFIEITRQMKLKVPEEKRARKAKKTGKCVVM